MRFADLLLIYHSGLKHKKIITKLIFRSSCNKPIAVYYFSGKARQQQQQQQKKKRTPILTL